MKPHGSQRMRSMTTIWGMVSELATKFTQSSKRNRIYRILMQWAFCIAAVFLGLRVSQEVNLTRLNFSPIEESSDLFSQISNQTVHHYKYWSDSKNQDTLVIPGIKKSPKVYVGRQPILTRPWPHPDPVEMAQAHKLIARVQLEQQRLYGIQSWKPIIAITPMYVRTFQCLHLTGLLHTLSLVRGPVTWIVIEAAGMCLYELRSIVSDETEVEALGRYEREKTILVWWSRMEARSNSKYSSRWTLESPLDIIVSARWSLWPDTIFPLISITSSRSEH